MWYGQKTTKTLKEYNMKLNRIKNMRPTGAKVLSFVILAVTLGFLAGCQNDPPPPPPILAT